MAKPKIQVLIDWNFNGDFLAADEDVTAYVEAFAFDHLRDLMTGHMNGAVLDLELRNDDHRFSPPKGTISGLKPGRKVWVRMWYPYDSFSDTANVLLDAHTLDEDADWTWVLPTGPRDFDISSNGVEVETRGSQVGDYLAVLDFAETDVWIAVNFKRGTDTTDHGGLVLRYVDTSNYAYIRFKNDYLEWRKVIGGSDTQIGQEAFTWANGASKFVAIRIHGDEAEVYVDKVKKGDAQDISDVAIDAGTRFGLFCDGPADHRWNDFGGFRSLFFGTVQSIRPRPARGSQYCYISATDDFEVFKNNHVRWGNYDITAGSGFPTTVEAASLDGLLRSSSWSLADSNFEMAHGAAKTNGPRDDEGIQALDFSGLDLIHQADDEIAALAYYFHGIGYLYGERRAHRTSAPHTTSKATYRDTYNGSDPGFVGLAWEDGRNAIINHVTVRITRSTETAATKVWESEQAKDTSLAIQFDANERRLFIVELKDFDVAENWIIPTATTDYLANTLANGTGTNITNELSRWYSTAEVAMDGKFKELHIRFGATPGYLTKLQVRADGWTYQDTVETTIEDSSSITNYNVRKKVIACAFIDRLEDAQTLAEHWVANGKDPKTALTLPLLAGDKPTLSNMVQRQISDRVTVVYSDMGINEDFFVEGESWVVSDGGTKVKQTLQLRAV